MSSSFKTELLAGFTTFFAMSYIIMVNPVILSEVGMSYSGVFTATIIVSVICTLLMALFANSPFALAPGMGINTFVAYVVCGSLGYHWREAMAITFIMGIIHVVLMLTGIRKEIVKAIPPSLKYATGAGIGIFIAYIGLKNSGLVIHGRLINVFSAEHFLSVFGLLLIIALLVMEKKNDENYGAFVLGILIVTFIGIPLGVTKINFKEFIDVSSIISLKNVAFSFFGDPGILSLFSSPLKILTSIMVIVILLLTCLVDGFSTIISIGQSNDPPVFKEGDQRLDCALIANSTGGIVAALLGSSSATTYIESVAGVTAGGKTGVSSIVVAVLFLLCLPFSSFFGIIPSAAIAPVLIVAGVYFFVSLLKHVEWKNIEDAIPCALVITFIPFTSSILDGVAMGYIAYIVICVMTGKARKVHLFIYMIAILFIAIIILRTLFKI